VGGVLAAGSHRDGWDWLLYGLSLTAAIAAVIGFGYWILDQRRRPEVKVTWLFSRRPETTSLAPWPADDVPDLRSSATVLIEVAIRNIGDRAPVSLLWNFVAPGSVQLKNLRDPSAKPLAALDPDEALGPGPEVVFFAGTAPWPPGTSLALYFEATYTAQPRTPAVPGRFLFKVADNRLNGSGRRRLLTVLPLDDPAPGRAASPWPPTKRHRRRLGRVVAEPTDRVACRPGLRQDVRDVLLKA
jgi:hypothetical protein